MKFFWCFIISLKEPEKERMNSEIFFLQRKEQYEYDYRILVLMQREKNGSPKDF